MMTAPERTPAFQGPYVVVLGTAQDGGIPHTGCQKPCCQAARREPALRRLPACLAIIDPASKQRWIIDCSPDFPAQLERLDEVSDASWGLAGIFLTHAHVGHYTGLIHLGREVMGTQMLPVYAMPRMMGFLRQDSPWKQLVDMGHIELKALGDGQPVSLAEGLSVEPVTVPHRDEISETVAFLVAGPQKQILHLPDIDGWEAWDHDLAQWLERVEVAWLDGTFFDGRELPGQRLADIPHPFMKQSLERFQTLPLRLRQRIQFTHLNHSNPVNDPNSPERAALIASGCGLAQELQQLGL